MRPRTVDDKAIIERYLAGEKFADIATACNVSQNTVAEVIKRNNVPKRQEQLTGDQRLAIATRYKNGESAAAIAAALGVSKGAVYNVVRKNGGVRRQMNSLSQSDEDAVVARYAAGEPVLQISKDFPSVHVQTLHNMLKRRGVVDSSRAKPRVGGDRKEQILDAIREGTNVPAVMQSFDVSESTVSRLLRKTRIDGEVIDLPQGRPKIYEVNDAAFDVLTPEALYWLGFIFADGCVYKNRLIVCLASKDVEHLRKLRAFLRSDYPIRETASVSSFNPDSTFVWFSPRSTHMTDRLREHGIVAKRIRTPPPELAASRDFWRGAVDGDGHLGVGLYGGYLYPHIGLAGQLTLLETFRNFLQSNNLPSLNPHRSKGSNVPSISTSGSTAGEIIKLLYRDSIIALDRKNTRAQRIIIGDIEKSTPYDEGPSTVYVDETDARYDDDE